LDSDKLIGQINLHDIDHLNRHVFIGIMIGEVEHQMLSVHEDASAAIACYTKAGFKESGRRREWIFKNGRYYDVLYMDILAREFGCIRGN